MAARKRGADRAQLVSRAAIWTVEELERRMLLTGVTASVPQWSNQGPGPLTGSNLVRLPPDQISNGAVEQIAIAPLYPEIAFVAGVDGGVWRTQSDLAGSPHWEPLTDNLGSLSMSAVAISPYDSAGEYIPSLNVANVSETTLLNELVVYAGFGRFSSGASDGGARLGLIYSTRGGQVGSWRSLGLSQLKNLDITSIVPSQSDAHVVYVSAQTPGGPTSAKAGVWKVTVGATASQTKLVQVLKGDVSQLVEAPSSPDTLYAGVPGQGIFRSTDGKGATWNNTGLGIGAASVKLAISAHSVFAAQIVKGTSGAGMLGGVYWWDESLTQWQLISPTPNVSPTPWNLQLSLAADPNNANVVFIGGGAFPGSNFGNIERGDITQPGVWQPVVMAGANLAGIETAPHSDSRSMIFGGDGAIWETDDGGVYRLSSPDDSSNRGWISRDGDLSVTEFYSAGYDSLTKSFFGGLQDNGVVEQPAGGGFQWNDVPTGDGTLVQVYNGAAAQTTRYISGANLDQIQRRVFDGTNPPTVTALTLNVNGASGHLGNPGAGGFDPLVWWQTPYAVNATDPNRILFATNALYESTDGGATVTPLAGLNTAKSQANPFGNGGTIRALAFGSTGAPDIAYVGQGNELYVREKKTKGDDTDFTLMVNYPGSDIRDIALDENDWHQSYLIDDHGRVYAFNEGTNTFTNITGNLGSKMTDLRTVEVIETGRADVPTIVLVGGTGGVYATLDPADGVKAKWIRVGADLPHTVVTDLHYDHSRSGDMLYCATWGRGVWSIDHFLGSFLPPPPLSGAAIALAPMATPQFAPALAAGDPGVLQITGDQSANLDDSFRLVLDPANPSILDVFVNNTTDQPDYSIDADSIQQVIVTGGQGNDTLTIDDANGQVSFPDGIQFDQSGPGVNVQQEINQTPVSSGVVSTIRDGLQAISDFGTKLAAFGQVAQQIPGLGKSIADTLSIGDGSSPIGGVLQAGLVDPINSFFTSTADPTVQGLVDFIKSLSGQTGNVFFGIDPLSVSGEEITNAAGHPELRIDLSLHLDGFAGQIPLDFSTQLSSLGLSFSSSGKVDFATALNLDFSFGVDLTPGLSDAQAFFINVNNLSASAHVSAGVLPQGQNDLISSGAGNSGGGDPDGGGHTDQLTGAPINVDFHLGFLDAQIVNGSVALDATVQVNVIDPDNDPDGNISLAELTGTSLGSLLDVNVDGSLDAELPVSISLAGLSNPSAQPLIKITSDDLFGSAPTVTAANFDQLTNFSNFSSGDFLVLIKQLVTELDHFRSSSVFNVSIPFTDKKLGDVLDFATAFTDKLVTPLSQSNGSPAFQTAQDLGTLLAQALGLDPSFLNVNFDPATNELTYHLALTETFAPQPVNLSLDTGVPLANLSVSTTINLLASISADLTLGIDLSPLQADETWADRFFIQDTSLSGSVRIDASDIEAAARLGFLGVGVQNGTGELLASASMTLQNPSAAPMLAFARPADAPATPPNPTRIPLKQIPNAIIAAPPAVTASAGANVDISKLAGNQTESAVAIDPTHPDRVVTIAMSDAQQAGMFLGTRNDDGTWSGKTIGTGPTMGGGDGLPFAGADPSLAFDSFGNLYVSYLNNLHTSVVVLISSDHGQTFKVLNQFNGVKFDRTALATGPSGTAGVQSVWVAYRNDDDNDPNAGIYAAGALISPSTGPNAPATQSTVGSFSPPELVPGSIVGNFAELAIGPNGQVLLTFAQADESKANGPTTIHTALDPDGLQPDGANPSKGFNSPITLVTNTEVGPNEPITAQSIRKITPAPSIAYDLSGLHHGRVYIVYTNQSTTNPDDTDIYVRWSDQDGAQGSWSKAVKVNKDGPGHSQFFPAIAVDPKTGNIIVSWYDTRDDAANKKVEEFAAVSGDGGTSFQPDFKVSAGQSDGSLSTPLNNPTNVQFGDYASIAFYNGVAWPVWADNSNSTGDNPEGATRFDVYTAQITVSGGANTHAQLAPLARPALAPAIDPPISFTGSLDLVLPISAQIGGTPLALPGSPAVEIHWGDLTQPFDASTDVKFPDLSDIANFKDMSFENLVAMLQKLVDYLKNLQSFSFLNTKLPLIDKSVADLVDFADSLATKIGQFQSNPQQTIQDAQTFLSNTLGVPITLTIDTPTDPAVPAALKFHFSPSFSYSGQPINLSFDLSSLSPTIGSLVGVGGDATLSNLAAGATLNLDFGLTLDGSFTPIVYDTTGLTLSASASATIPEFHATLGGFFGIYVKNGSMTLDRDGSGPSTAPATFALKLKSAADGRYDLGSIGVSDAIIQLNAGIDADLPLYFPDDSTPLGSPSNHLTVHIANHDVGSQQFTGTFDTVNITPPDVDLSSLLSSFDLRNNLSGLLDGAYTLLGFLQNAMQSGVLNRNLPLVGGHMKDGASFIGDVRDQIQAIRAAQQDLSVDAVRQAILDALTPLLTSVQVTTVHDDADNVEFLLHLQETAMLSNVNFDLGLPSIGLSAAGAIDAALNFDMYLGIGISSQNGTPQIYLDTAAAGLDAHGNPLPDLKVGFNLGLSGFNAEGNLGFLKVNLKDEPGDPTSFAGEFDVALLDPSGDGSNRLTVDELNGGATLAQTVDARLNANANVNLAIHVDFDNGSAKFPSLNTDLNLSWGFNNASTASSDNQFGDTPHVAFNNITLDLGSFFSGFASEVFGEVQKVLAPLQPLKDLLDTELSPLEKIDSIRNFFDVNKDKIVTVREVIEKLDPSPVFDFLDAMDALDNLVSSIPSGNSFELNLGSFDLNSTDLRSVSNLNNVSPADVNEADVASQLGNNAQTHNFAMALQDPKLDGSSGGDFEIPLLQHPAQAFKLLLGQDVNLFQWTTPKLALDLSIDKEFPVLGPIDVSVDGEVKVTAQATFGYDTTGLRAWRSSGDESKILDGFYLVSSGPGKSEITALGKIGVGLGVDLIVASADVSGSLLGTLDIPLDDPNKDGKVRFGELESNFALGPLCVFDINGSLALQLSVHASVGVWPVDDSFDYDSPTITLLTFSHDCKNSATDPDPVLATDIGGGVLRLNMGPNAADRGSVNTTDGDESFTVGPDPNHAGNVLVSAFGYSQSFSGITEILADGGAGNDSIKIDPSLNVNAVLLGGPGNDTIVAGAGNATIVGDGGQVSGTDGDDQLTGGSANDTIFGLGGNDTITGGGGNDSLNGGDGNNFVYGEAGDDTLIGGSGDDHLFGGDGNDSLSGNGGNDTLEGDAGDDTLLGGDGNDVFHGGDGNDSLVGGAGDDSLAGDAGNDTLDAGDGNDVLVGGDGNDLLLGGAGNDTADAGAGDDVLSGGDGNDSLLGGDGNDSITGDAGNDTLSGGAGNDTVLGGDGNDVIDGGDNNDLLDGGTGDDAIHGSAGDDTITGGTGNDSLFGDDGNDSILGGDGNDSIEGGTGNDILSGGTGDDTLRGQEGNDSLSGDDGNDVLFGDAGNDTLVGGDGNDQLNGGADNDLAYGNAGNDTIFGDDGNDTLIGGSGDDSIVGNAGNDLLIGDDTVSGPAGNDYLDGGAGDDTLFGDNASASSLNPIDGAGNDSMFGGAGNDLMYGQDGSDSMSGGDDQDTMFGNAGNDSMSGDAGNDLMVGGAGNDTMSGGDGDDLMIGDDTVSGPAGNDSMDGGAGNDTMFGDNADPVSRTMIDGAGNDTMLGGDGNDLMYGQGGDDSMSGGTGNDTMLGNDGNDTMSGDAGDDDMIGGYGNDWMDGGDGSDGMIGDNGTIFDQLLDGYTIQTITSSGGRMVATINQAGTLERFIALLDPSNGGDDTMFGGSGDDFIHGGAGNDALSGGDGNDALFGDLGNDSMNGGAGTDHLYGGSGNDTLDGGSGADILYGGDGADTLIADQSGDRLVDWFGNFNTFVTPGPGNGGPIVIRSPDPSTQQFLLALAAADGALDANGELVVVTPPSPSNAGH